MTGKNITVLIVDDHELVRTCFKHWLETTGDIKVVGVAGNGEQSLILARELDPDVILMDLAMPGIGGLEASRRLCESRIRGGIIALSMYEENSIPVALLRMGASGYVSKHARGEELIEAIRCVSRGERYFSHAVNQRLYNSVATSADKSLFSELSSREMEVARMIFKAKTINEISRELQINCKTVNTYRYRIHEKLNVRNDMELLLLAVKENLLHTD